MLPEAVGTRGKGQRKPQSCIESFSQHRFMLSQQRKLRVSALIVV